MKIAGRFKKPNACLRCGQEGFHQKYEDCPALKAKCNACGKIGHYAKMCLSKGNSNRLKYSDKFSKYYSLRLWLNTLRQETKPIRIKVNINGNSTTMLCDTGANISCIDKTLWESLNTPLRKISARVTGYMGNEIPILGYASVEVPLGELKKNLPTFQYSVLTGSMHLE
ncbi:hypothetical protein RF11_12050 [Thelohanellus kitauei]|uniref:CCHC-type domain-containing protein n=1 Tax=Thelohanellus kitauei TaxID=669202 RepID=A0A0C2MX79_THEKT|nr:hypothetical protein RF11_12050 [Thelohanellus kitauei]